MNKMNSLKDMMNKLQAEDEEVYGKNILCCHKKGKVLKYSLKSTHTHKKVKRWEFVMG